MIKIKNKYQFITKSISLISILIFFSFLIINSNYLHIHKNSTGFTIVHSHLPANNTGSSGSTEHSHNSFEFLNLLLSNILISFGIYILCFILFFEGRVWKIYKHKFQLSDHTLHLNYLRAPPLSLLRFPDYC